MSSRREPDIQRLQRLLEEANLRAKEEQKARQEAEQARQEADLRAKEEQKARREADLRVKEEQKARQEAEQARQEADQRVEKDKERNQPTTFHEFLKACHEHLQKALCVESKKSSTTKGYTNQRFKNFPSSLRLWKEFPQLQRDCFDSIHRQLHPPDRLAPRVFDPVITIELMGQRLRDRQLSSERDLEYYERRAVEDQATDIFKYLGKGIRFENHTNSLSNMENEEHLRIRTPETSPQSSQSSSFSSSSTIDQVHNPKYVRSNADQFCVYKDVDDNRQLLFIIEYKPPHKYSIDTLRAGFREMDVTDVVDRATIPNDEKARIQQRADELVAAVATQVFHEMIQNGLPYSYITTGQVFVFLYIKEDDPTSLYYHTVIPDEEVDANQMEFKYSQTAISQVVSFGLIAFSSEHRSHGWRKQAKEKLGRYQVDNDENVLRQMSNKKKAPTPASEKKSYKGRKNLAITGSPPMTRQRARCKQANLQKHYDESDDGSDVPESSSKVSGQKTSKSSSKTGSQPKEGGSNNSKGSKSSGKGSIGRQYCTQACLMGIAKRSSLDEKCPNVLEHRRHGPQHAIDRSTFASLVQKQLGEDLDNNFEPLGLQGARGALIRITLASHGYTFVGKGTVHAFVRDLLHEGKVYEHLEPIQGAFIPAYLGNIDLIDWYQLDIRVSIRHVLLMSWGGRDISTEEWESSPQLREETMRTVSEVRKRGINQADVETRNLLWNAELGRVMLIDFERARWIECGIHVAKIAKKPMQEISPNKKREQTRYPAEFSKRRRREAFPI